MELYFMVCTDSRRLVILITDYLYVNTLLYYKKRKYDVRKNVIITTYKGYLLVNTVYRNVQNSYL